MNNIKQLLNTFMLLVWLSLSYATQAAEKIVYLHPDASGSPVAASDESGNLLWRESYRPYGERVQNTDNGDNDQWYTGKIFDEETQLSYFGARYYDPVVGRFMGIDPVAFQEDNIHSFNRYAYANNNPYRYVDPDGESPIDVVFLAVDTVKLVSAVQSGVGINVAAADFAASLVGVISPVPGTGQLLKAGKISRLATKSPLARGRAAEQRVLNNLGLSKNTQKVRTGEGASIPDALTKRQSIEIKDCISVSCTRQIRIQTEAARNSGRTPVLITGSKTHVSRPARRRFGGENIIRRPDLGPQ